MVSQYLGGPGVSFNFEYEGFKLKTPKPCSNFEGLATEVWDLGPS